MRACRRGRCGLKERREGLGNRPGENGVLCSDLKKTIGRVVWGAVKEVLRIMFWKILMSPLRSFSKPLKQELVQGRGSNARVVPAAAAESLHSCPTLCDPKDGSPAGSAIPGILQARTLEWVSTSFSNARK